MSTMARDRCADTGELFSRRMNEKDIAHHMAIAKNTTKRERRGEGLEREKRRLLSRDCALNTSFLRGKHERDYRLSATPYLGDRGCSPCPYALYGDTGINTCVTIYDISIRTGIPETEVWEHVRVLDELELLALQEDCEIVWHKVRNKAS